MTQPQREFLKWLEAYNGRCVMARYDRPMFGDYGPTIRRLLRRRMVVATYSRDGFPFLNLTETGKRALALSNGNQGDAA